jgi:hypothetical protein
VWGRTPANTNTLMIRRKQNKQRSREANRQRGNFCLLDVSFFYSTLLFVWFLLCRICFPTIQIFIKHVPWKNSKYELLNCWINLLSVRYRSWIISITSIKWRHHRKTCLS